jgi:hypothetical protein
MGIDLKYVFHCLDCGQVVHVTNESDPPQCCGRSMFHACDDRTTHDDLANIWQTDFIVSIKGECE